MTKLEDLIKDSYNRVLLMEEFRRGPIEITEWDWYDRLTVVKGCERLLFFQHTEGSATWYTSDTNMQISAQLAGYRAFIMAGLAFIVRRKDRVRWEELSHSASLRFCITDKIYRVAHCATIPVLDQDASLSRRVIREMKVPGKSWTRTVEEERVSRWLRFDPHLIILPYRPFCAEVTFRPVPGIMTPLPLGMSLIGWDIRQLL